MSQKFVGLDRNRGRSWLGLLGAAAVALLLLSGCGSSASSAKSGSTLTIANFSPFSGPNNDYGYLEQSGCMAALHYINADGGVNGHKLTCQIVDSRGDPADAVPAAQKMLATTSNLDGPAAACIKHKPKKTPAQN